MRVLAVMLLLAPLLAGCGDGDGDSGYVRPDTTQDGGYLIELTSERSFHPERAKVPTDARVVFEFGLDGCDVRSEQPGGPDSSVNSAYNNGIHGPGERYSWFAPSEPATFDIYCSKHRSGGMTGVLRVG